MKFLIKLLVLFFCLYFLSGCNSHSRSNMQTNFIDTLKTKDVSSSHITKDSNKLTTIKSENNYYFEPNISAIIGTLKVEMFYGPPNFGDSPKTDSKEYSYILHLDTAINVIQTSDSTDFNVTTIGVTKVQLVLLDNLSLYPYLNKRIKVSGQFFGMQTGHHHTDVLMTVSKVEKLCQQLKLPIKINISQIDPIKNLTLAG